MEDWSDGLHESILHRLQLRAKFDVDKSSVAGDLLRLRLLPNAGDQRIAGIMPHVELGHKSVAAHWCADFFRLPLIGVSVAGTEGGNNNAIEPLSAPQDPGSQALSITSYPDLFPIEVRCVCTWARGYVCWSAPMRVRVR